jgi:hypothetical protein
MLLDLKSNIVKVKTGNTVQSKEILGFLNIKVMLKVVKLICELKLLLGNTAKR